MRGICHETDVARRATAWTEIGPDSDGLHPPAARAAGRRAGARAASLLVLVLHRAALVRLERVGVVAAPAGGGVDHFGHLRLGEDDAADGLGLGEHVPVEQLDGEGRGLLLGEVEDEGLVPVGGIRVLDDLPSTSAGRVRKSAGGRGGVRVCVGACVRALCACMRACVRACVRAACGFVLCVPTLVSRVSPQKVRRTKGSMVPKASILGRLRAEATCTRGARVWEDEVEPIFCVPKIPVKPSFQNR